MIGSAHTQLSYAVAVRPATTVWWGEHQPAPTARSTPGPAAHARGRDSAHQPISVLDLARALPAESYRTVTGAKAPTRRSPRALHGCACAPHTAIGRVRKNGCSSNGRKAKPSPPTTSCATCLNRSRFEDLVTTVKMRWRIERDYLELKQELGLGHYEGRNWRGFHHHASLCIAAYGFLMLERLAGVKKNAARLTSACPTRKLPPAWGSARCSATSRGRSRPCAIAWRAPSHDDFRNVHAAGNHTGGQRVIRNTVRLGAGAVGANQTVKSAN